MTAPHLRPPGIAPTISLGTQLAGFSHLLRLAWRRDRILVPSSVLGLVLLAVGSAQATLALYPTDEAASTGLAGVLSNPSVIALYGPVASNTADALAVFKTADDGRVPHRGARLRRRAPAHPHRGGRGAPRAARRRRRRPLVGPGCRRHPGRPSPSSPPACSRVRGWRRWAWTRPAASPSPSRGWRRGSPWSASRPSRCSSPRPRAAPPGSGSASSARCSRCGRIADSADPGTFAHGLGWLSPLGWAGRVEAYGANRTWLLLLGVLTLVVRRRRCRRPARPP